MMKAKESKSNKSELKSTVKKLIPMAFYLDQLITNGGAWKDLIKKAQAEGLKRELKTKYGKGSFTSHIKFRENQAKGWIKGRNLKITEEGISIATK